VLEHSVTSTELPREGIVQLPGIGVVVTVLVVVIRLQVGAVPTRGAS
jgi:hypothetical protein